MSFNAAKYLHHNDPDIEYTILPVTGGVVNVTLRAVKANDTDVHRGRFSNRRSLILKHAPPYIARLGPDVPMTQDRQLTEAQALALFLQSPQGLLQEIPVESQVIVPELLYHDADASVLIMSDLGELPNLTDIFSDLGGYIADASITDYQHTHLFNMTAGPSSVFHVSGVRLGTFFAHLHSTITYSKVHARFPDVPFVNEEIHSVVLRGGIKPIENLLLKFPDLVSSKEAKQLTQILVTDFLRDPLPEEPSFVLGDCWPAAFLISSSPTTSPDYQTPSLKVGVIDWEFSGYGRGPHGDMAQLLAHLDLLRIVAAQDATKFAKQGEAVETLLTSLVSSYKSTRSRISPEVRDESNLARSERRPSPTELRAIVLRSAFLSYAAELINCAFRKEWVCVMPECVRGEDGTHTDIKYECRLVWRIVQQGLWYLTHGCESLEMFCGGENWKEIRSEDQKRKEKSEVWLLDLL